MSADSLGGPYGWFGRCLSTRREVLNTFLGLLFGNLLIFIRLLPGPARTSVFLLFESAARPEFDFHAKMAKNGDLWRCA